MVVWLAFVVALPVVAGVCDVGSDVIDEDILKKSFGGLMCYGFVWKER